MTMDFLLYCACRACSDECASELLESRLLLTVVPGVFDGSFIVWRRAEVLSMSYLHVELLLLHVERFNVILTFYFCFRLRRRFEKRSL